MFIFTAPYISELVKDFINDTTPEIIVANDFLSEHSFDKSASFLNSESVRKRLLEQDGRWIYSNNETALEMIDGLLPAKHRLLDTIRLFKDKHRFRESYREEFPDIEFKLLSLNELMKLHFDDFAKPFIIKPSIGFLSAGVYRVNSQQELLKVQSIMISEMNKSSKVFSKSVIDSTNFLIESIISGREFAIDAYYDDNSEPVILNIFEHIFRDELDMSDRLYVTSLQLINKWLKPFTDFLRKLKTRADLKGFVLHAEIRVDSDGIIRPIEINPLRFAGWCTTDLANFAYRINPYSYLAERKKPDWDAIATTDTGKLHCMSVISSNLVSTTSSFDYQALASRFSDLKELRDIDFKKYPLFGFAFFSIEESDYEFKNWLLNEDFSSFCK